MKYTREILESIVKESKNYSDAVRRLTNSDKVHGSKLAYVKKKIEEFDIDTSHFNGKYWCLGRINPTGIALTKQDFTKYLQNNGLSINTARLKNGLIKLGYKSWQCEMCGNNGMWMGESLCLQIDHIDGNSSNNELTNLI